MPAYISAISSALPDHVTAQSAIADFMIHHQKMNDAEARQLKILYRASGIQQRYSVLPDFGNLKLSDPFFKPNLKIPGVGSRMDLYQHHAPLLAKKAVGQLLKSTKVEKQEITHLITVSCTGMYAPGLDIDIVNLCGLNRHTERTCINFMGCYAAFNALKVAYYITKTNPQAKVLVLCLELCTLHFSTDKNEETLLANALFGDGAAAALISGLPTSGFNFRIDGFDNTIEPAGSTHMGWLIRDLGFEMRLSSEVPEFIQKSIGEMVDHLLLKHDLTLADIDYYAIHPGGKKILTVVEQEMGIPAHAAKFSHDVLREFGNMSSATLLFVLQKIMESSLETDQIKKVLAFAFGPGLTLESMLLNLHHEA